jgi:hypothetical protein
MKRPSRVSGLLEENDSAGAVIRLAWKFGVVNAMRITAPKGAPRLMLAACFWLSDIRDCWRVTQLLEVCDLCLAARVGGRQIEVSVDVATKAIAAVARRLEINLVPHATLMARLRDEVR